MNKDGAIKIIQKLDALNLEVGSSGNISFRANSKTIYIKPTGFAYTDVTSDNLSVVAMSGSMVAGLGPSSDVSAHLEIYRARPDVHCIVHSHSHFATVFALLGMPLSVHSTMHADYFGSKIPCLPFVNHRVDNFATQFISYKVDTALLEKHGSLLLLNNPSDAPLRLLALEEVAKLQYHALSLALLQDIELSEIRNSEVSIINAYYQNKYGQ